VSYSVYLVHFPVMLMVTTKRFGLETWPMVWLKLALTFVVGLALFYGVEQPIRRRNDLSNGTTVKWWLAGSASVTLLAVLVLPN
jgi:peptidoglycan/LPS O-acetylase OafA/YrhL